jgi:cytochrome P450
VTSAPHSDSDSADMFARANEARDRAMGIGIIDDPYPVYHDLQARCPVRHGTTSDAFGFTGMDGLIHPDRPHISVFSYELVEQVLKDTSTFSSSWYDPQLGPTIGRSILHMDPPEHQRHRMVVQPAFARREMDWWETEYVRPTCDHYIDRFVDDGRADLYRDYCVRVPIHVISLALGLPTEDLPWFHGVAVRITTGGTTPEDSAEARRELEARLRPLIAARHDEPGRDLISVIVHGSVREPNGVEHRLNDEEILTFCKLLLPAGANTTYRSLGLMLTELFHHPDQLERLRADRSLIPACVEELVRIEHSTSVIGRICTRDTELGGEPVAAGTVVLLSLAAGNHDAERWEEPEHFDIGRPAVPNVAFGWGYHRCLGIHLARMELRVALETLLDRLPGLRPDPSVPLPHITGLMFRAPDHVRAVWEVGAR